MKPKLILRIYANKLSLPVSHNFKPTTENTTFNSTTAKDYSGNDTSSLLIPPANPCRRTQQRQKAIDEGFTQAWDTVGAGANIPRRRELNQGERMAPQ